jgi:ubiquinone/menaquinone biosynthesis C-methylase UbiE
MRMRLPGFFDHEPPSTDAMNGYYAKTMYSGQTAAQYDTIRKSGILNRLRWKSEMHQVESVVRSFPKGQRILDVPCGTGRFLPLFLGADHEVVGMDISTDMLDHIPDSCRSPRLSLEQGDAQRLKFADKSFDYIFSLRLFNHLPEAVRLDVLKEFRRVARKGVIIQLRFASPLEVPGVRWSDAARDLARIALWRAKTLIARNGPGTRPSLRRRIARPRFGQFRHLAASVGLRLVECYPIFWGPTLSPMKLCVLEPIE